MSERFFLECIQQSCNTHDIELTIRSDGWLLELTKDNRKHRIIGTSFDLNDQVSAAIAKDKAATSELLSESGIGQVPHSLVKPRGGSIDIATVRRHLARGPLVIKPLEGSRGELVDRADSESEALSLMSRSGAHAWAVSPFEDIVSEIRLVVVSGEVRLAYEKTNPVMRGKLRLFNLHLGAGAESLRRDDVSKEVIEMAVRASSALGLQIAAIDIVITNQGVPLILEVNAAFSLNKFAGSSDAARSEVAALYDEIVMEMFGSS